MKSCARALWASALINVKTNSFIFFMTANGHCAQKGKGLGSLLSLWYSHRKLQFSRVERFLEGSFVARTSTDRYSLKANPDKLVHLLHLAVPLDRFWYRSYILSHIIGNCVANQNYFVNFDDRDNQVKSSHKLSFVFFFLLYQPIYNCFLSVHFWCETL